MMLRFISIFLIIFISFIQLSYADNEVSTEKSIVVSVKKGETVPFNGSLLNSVAIAKILAEKEYLDKKCQLDKEYNLLKQKAGYDLNLGKCIVEKSIIDQKYILVNEIKDNENKKLQELLLKSEKRSSNYVWWLGGGFLGGIVLTTSIVYAVMK